MAQWCRKYKIAVRAWCLMPNHVHLIAVPQDETGLARAVGEAHRRYTRRINFREQWRGHLWQDLFESFPMDEQHLLATARYIEMNPVAAGIAVRPGDYRWSRPVPISRERTMNWWLLPLFLSWFLTGKIF